MHGLFLKVLQLPMLTTTNAFQTFLDKPGRKQNKI